ncbi:hypothetical protein KUL72_20695 [Bradyrhizobium arachidis]|uniref:hypothetical protein n=1 Tax=Bradyrhizobium arachidis TaxID=858423 RepID=UPI0021622D6C|nr:hypothetical protein [Bradyrhizobium arachidis]UVO33935.1 hypothetical protein KUL72_20695 [Bradyrhizobium arachidis]
MKNWRSDRVYGERRGTKRTIKLGGGVTTSVYLDDPTWERFKRERIVSGKSARELVVLAEQMPGYNLSDKIRNLLH